MKFAQNPKIYLENWKREHEQALKDIRPFDESMLQLKNQETEIAAEQTEEREQD